VATKWSLKKEAVKRKKEANHWDRRKTVEGEEKSDGS
jgi:hypothetical protein